MALEIADRVKETTTTTSTGTYTLAGAVDGFQSFAAVGDGNTTYYACTDGTDYEVGVGSYTASGTTLSRVTILESSNSDAAVNWGAGTKEIFVTVPAEKYLVRDASGNVSLTGNLTVSGTVDGRDVSADGSKLDGIESGATADQTAAQIRAKVEAASDSNVFTDADHAKLNGIEANAKDDQTITAGSGLTGGGTGDVTLSHADTSSQASVNGSGRTYIQDITLDTYGHVTGLATATETVVNTDTLPNNATITITAGNALTGGGNFTTDQASNETITINHQDTSSQASVNNSGRTYIQDITLDSYGHVTGISSATETVTNTNTNQLTTFQLEDGDGTEVTISHGKEVKFVEGGGIDINWTDTSNGTDGDPYDLTFTHADTSSQGSVDNSNGTVIQDVTLDGYGHVTALGSVNLDNRYTLKDHIRSIGVPVFTGGTNPNITTAQLVTEMENDGSFDSYSSVFKTSWSYAGNYDLSDAGGFTETAGTSWITWTDNSSDSTRGNITALAIAPNTGGSAGGVFIYNDQGSSYSPGWREVWTSMTDGSGSGLDADLLDGQHGSYYYPASNPNGYTTNVGDITGVTAGDGLSGGGTSGTVTVSHGDTSTLSGTYGSTANGTKIDQITVDANGHVTAITTGATGSMSSFNVQANGGTQVAVSNGEELNFINGNATTVSVTNQNNPTVQFNHADTSSQASVNNSGRTYIQDITLDTYGHVTGITSATETVTDTNTTYSLVASQSGGTNADPNLFLNASSGTDYNVQLVGSGATTVTRNSDGQITISSTDTNTNTNQLTTFQLEDGDGTEVTISHGKEIKFVEGGNIDINWTDTSTGSDTDPYDLTFTVSSTPSFTSIYLADNIYHSADADTYMGFHAADQWRVVTAGGERLEVNSTNTTVQNTLLGKNATFDNGTSTTLSVKCDDAGLALIRANGDSQGTGAVEVGQSNDYGGGISYNGDGSPAFASGETADAITFYRMSAGTRTEVFSYPYNANLVTFNGGITIGDDLTLPDQIIHTGDSDTYMQFHASDQWRVVVGGSERLEVKNASPHVLVTGDLNSTSDARLKENVKPIANALSDITQLEGVSFDWKDTGTRGHGFIAQQVEPILPDVVQTDDETGMKSINYVGMIGHLVEAIKEQQTQIDALTAQVEELKR